MVYRVVDTNSKHENIFKQIENSQLFLRFHWLRMGGDRWVTLAASLLLELCAGTAYAFGTYSSQLKSVIQGGTQSEIDTISSIGNGGSLLSYWGNHLSLSAPTSPPKVCVLCVRARARVCGSLGSSTVR